MRGLVVAVLVATTVGAFGCRDDGAPDGTPATDVSDADQTPTTKRGWDYVSQGESAKAVAEFTRVIELAPNYSQGYLGLGVAADLVGDDRHAILDLDQAERLQPGGSPEAVLWLMLVARQMHRDFGGELAEVPQHMEYGQWPGPIMRFLDHVWSEDALWQAATTEYSAAPINVRKCQALLFIGEVDQADGRSDAARRHFEQARDICPNDRHESAVALAELKRIEGPE